MRQNANHAAPATPVEVHKKKKNEALLSLSIGREARKIRGIGSGAD
jgi:hypothetical protein